MPRWVLWLLWIGCTVILLLCYAWVLPVLLPVPLTPTPLPTAATATAQPSTTVTATATAAAPQSTATVLPTPTSSATPSPTVPAPTLAPLPNSAIITDLRKPVLVDRSMGRLYAAGVYQGREQTIALSSRDVRPLAAYDITGALALDGKNGWLYVDRAAQGFAVLRLDTGMQTALVPLPVTGLSTPPAPLADSVHGLALAFRNATVLFVDPQQGQVVRAWAADVRNAPGSCSTSTGPLPIQDALLDAPHGILYLEFVTYSCVPYTGYTIVAYDLATGAEIGRTSGSGPTGQATVGDGVLYGSSWNRMGSGNRWSWKPGEAAIDSSGWRNGFAHLFVDPKRQRVLEAAGGDVWVHDARNMRLAMIGSAPVKGDLVALDPETDNVFFLQGGQLLVRSAGAIASSPPQGMVAAAVPTQPLRSLIAAAGLGEEVFHFGIWQAEQTGTCWALNQTPGKLYVSSDGGNVWHHPTSGMDTTCANVTTAAVSPDFGADRTVWVGLLGLGLFRTIDGGNMWQSVGTGLSSQGWRQIWLSPAVAKDRTMLALATTGTLYRSTDTGVSWEPLDEKPCALAMSSEFGEDRTLLGAFTVESDGSQMIELRLSQDAGDTWSRVSEGTQGEQVHWLGMAPLFAKWRIAFLWDGQGALLRTADGGAHWQTVLTTPAPDYDLFSASPPLVFAPGDEEHRTVYLVVSWSEAQGDDQTLRGKLYRSTDGGLTWAALRLPASVQATAIALSPHYQLDARVFIGTSDGRVLTLLASALESE
jgi:photosystem II stability/assembly factor-like uncharacterized protein